MASSWIFKTRPTNWSRPEPAPPHWLAGRGLRWQLYAHGPLGALLPVDPSNGLLFVAVWLADDPRRAETDSLVVHAAVRGPALTHRAVQATVRRRAMSQPATLPPVVVVSWRLVR